MINCRHCDRECEGFSRGLCRPCWRKKDIRDLHPMEIRQTAGIRHSDEDATEAELDALIESRRPTMPGGDMREPQLLDVPRCVAAGKGISVRRKRENW
jgi:hypothetical protein